MRSRFSVQPSGHTSECFQILPMYGRQEVLTAKLWQVNSNDESNGSTVLSVIAVRLFVVGRGWWPSNVLNRGSSELFIFLVVYRFRANVSWSFLHTHEHPNTST